ncbi:hypothetical protein A4X03_0g9255, partial [Tilletia caries]
MKKLKKKPNTKNHGENMKPMKPVATATASSAGQIDGSGRTTTVCGSASTTLVATTSRRSAR